MNERLRITLNSIRAVSGVGQTISNSDDFSHDLSVRGFSGNSSAILIQSRKLLFVSLFYEKRLAFT